MFALQCTHTTLVFLASRCEVCVHVVTSMPDLAHHSSSSSSFRTTENQSVCSMLMHWESGWSMNQFTANQHISSSVSVETSLCLLSWQCEFNVCMPFSCSEAKVQAGKSSLLSVTVNSCQCYLLLYTVNSSHSRCWRRKISDKVWLE